MPAYTLIHDDLFVQKLAEIEPDPKKADALVDNTTFIIANVPHEFTPIGSTKLRRTFGSSNSSIRIWFTFDDEEELILRLVERCDLPKGYETLF